MHFGGLPEGGLLETGFGHAKLGEYNSDSSDLDESAPAAGFIAG